MPISNPFQSCQSGPDARDVHQESAPPGNGNKRLRGLPRPGLTTPGETEQENNADIDSEERDTHADVDSEEQEDHADALSDEEERQNTYRYESERGEPAPLPDLRDEEIVDVDRYKPAVVTLSNIPRRDVERTRDPELRDYLTEFNKLMAKSTKAKNRISNGIRQRNVALSKLQEERKTAEQELCRVCFPLATLVLGFPE